MNDLTLTTALRQYIVTEILEGNDEGFTTQTPLLEWGLLNSMEMVRLLAYIHRQFAVEIAPDHVTPAHFQTVDSIVQLVKRQAAAGEMNA